VMSNVTWIRWEIFPQNIEQNNNRDLGLFVILGREVREGRIRVIREEDRVQRCEGIKVDDRGKKVNKPGLRKLYVTERELCT